MLAGRTWHLQRLLLLLAAIALLPSLIAGGWAIQSAMERHRVEVERSAQDLSRALATAVASEIEATAAALRTLSQAQSLARDDLPAFYEIAHRVQQANPGWQAVILTDGQGRLLFNTARGYGGEGAAIIDPDSLRKIMQTGEPTAGSVLTGPRGNTAFPVRIPVRRGAAMPYVLSAAVYPQRVLDVLRQQKTPADWVVAVFDASGRRVARTRAHASKEASPSLVKLLSRGDQEGVGITTTLEGVQAVTGFTRVSDYGWTVAVAVPTSGSAEKFLAGGGPLYLSGILASLLAWAIAATLLSRRIAASVDRLRERATGLVTEGQLLSPMQTHISEIAEADAALVAMSGVRAQIDTERRELLDSLNASLATTREALMQAEEAARAKDNFLAMLGHEMRNPLAPIVSALDLLELRGNPGDVRERAILRRQVDHLHRLVDDLMEVSRIAQNKLHINTRPVDLREILRVAQESAHREAESRAMALVLTLPDQPVMVDGDAVRLEQVLSNLISNALRFAASRISLTLVAEEDHARVSVEDDGAGMDAATLGGLFQPFFQAPQSLARSRGGLGLGLAIVKSIVELHGGQVEASSPGAGRGSRFEIRLPRLTGPDAQSDPRETAAAGEPRRVLVVDDNVDAADLIAACLASLGHHARSVHSGREALVLMQSFRPEVAILDIGMPEMDGYQLARAIRSQDPGWRGQLIALSGYGQADDKEKAYAAGFDRHLTKPVQMDDLNQAVATPAKI